MNSHRALTHALLAAFEAEGVEVQTYPVANFAPADLVPGDAVLNLGDVTVTHGHLSRNAKPTPSQWGGRPPVEHTIFDEVDFAPFDRKRAYDGKRMQAWIMAMQAAVRGETMTFVDFEGPTGRERDLLFGDAPSLLATFPERVIGGADRPTAPWLRKHGLVGLADQYEREPVLFARTGYPAITDIVR